MGKKRIENLKFNNVLVKEFGTLLSNCDLIILYKFRALPVGAIPCGCPH
jgi:hypothetical protein